MTGGARAGGRGAGHPREHDHRAGEPGAVHGRDHVQARAAQRLHPRPQGHLRAHPCRRHDGIGGDAKGASPAPFRSTIAASTWDALALHARPPRQR
eukprot:1187813-Prorocentrum_minimum.AAC.5